MPRIAIFHPAGDINNNPNLSAFCDLLHYNKFTVDIWSHANKNNPNQLKTKSKVNLYLLSNFNESISIIADYSIIIGIDQGILLAKKTAEVLNIPYALLSYELFFDHELKGRKEKQQKQAEKLACSNLAFAIIQDSERANLLCKEYDISPEKVLFMPVAGTGEVEFQRSYFLHNHLKLPLDTKILLHIGSVSNWTMIDWAIKHSYSLPEKWVLVIHNRYGGDFRSNNYSNVFYSNLPSFPMENMHLLIQSANCTLALYEPSPTSPYTGDNLLHIGLSSGKISTSLQYGVPVITKSLGLISDYIQVYNAGRIIDINSDNPFSILSNLEDSNYLAMNCHKLFSEKLEIQNYFPLILQRIKSLTENHNLTINYNSLANEGAVVTRYFYQLTLKNKIMLLMKFVRMLLLHSILKLIKKN